MSAQSVTDALARQLELHRGMAHLFELAMRHGGLPPLAALESLASMLGRIYGDVARAHGDPGCCSCGWQPAASDLEALNDAMRVAAGPVPRADLRTMVPVGSA